MDDVRRGRVEVISGPMFAGKTEELLRRVRRARIAGRRVEVVHHALDDRRGEGLVSSHSGLDIPSRAATSAAEILELVDPAVELVAVDEAQFFGPALLDVVQHAADAGLVMIVAGLDVTFDGRPFEPIPALGALAERADRLTAVCTVCGEDAPFHERVVASADGDSLTPGVEHVGGVESYQARCRVHFEAARWRAAGAGGPTVTTR
ncbi:thymidine kinase [Oerskovia sp. Sa1BUA8]|uniref:Thymidine kinase n=1 Tax=Oerskovia douganii TaxID=2762210 RepID=A0A9D5UCS2_9CELL|nr:thymidine kinase [Oerskovia douganii]MBE7701969.1 thymidine kinase [Oerskovia douganii]